MWPTLHQAVLPPGRTSERPPGWLPCLAPLPLVPPPLPPPSRQPSPASTSVSLPSTLCSVSPLTCRVTTKCHQAGTENFSLDPSAPLSSSTPCSRLSRLLYIPQPRPALTSPCQCSGCALHLAFPPASSPEFIF